MEEILLVIKQKMVFSNITDKSGLIQSVEFWTRQPDAGISDNATLLYQITTRINAAFEKILPMLLMNSDRITWDDTNHTDLPVGTMNLVSGQSDYKIGHDDNTLDILNLTAVRILPSSTETIYSELERMTLDDESVLDAISPNSDITGVPSYFLENSDKLFLYPEPNYSATNGIQLFFAREQYYFVYTDTTKEPGIPKPFHELLALYASLDWNMVNRTDEGNLISMLRVKIIETEKNLKAFMALRNPTRKILTPKKINFI